MRAEQFDSTVRALVERRPFRPFTIVQMNDDNYQFDYPLAITMRDGFAMHLAPGRIPVFMDHDGVSQIIGDFIPTAGE
jgi:hypothetical protein